MKLIFNNNIEISKLKEILDIARFVMNAQCINDEIQIISDGGLSEQTVKFVSIEDKDR